jgi:LysR family pca operon transcriptional activator
MTHGINELPQTIETVSDAFGRNYVQQTDAVWIISNGVIAIDVAQGKLEEIPLDVKETLGPVGLTTRADKIMSTELQLFMVSVKQVAGDLSKSQF